LIGLGRTTPSQEDERDEHEESDAEEGELLAGGDRRRPTADGGDRGEAASGATVRG
jgi:hypothetical protein